jgi:hypothetical protein
MVYTVDIYWFECLNILKCQRPTLPGSSRTAAARQCGSRANSALRATTYASKKMGSGVLLEPLIQDPAELFRRLDELNSEPFPARGKQPPITKRLPLK